MWVGNHGVNLEPARSSPTLFGRMDRWFEIRPHPSGVGVHISFSEGDLRTMEGDLRAMPSDLRNT